jgi:hypothetical protein
MPQLLGPDTGLMPQAHPFIIVWRCQDLCALTHLSHFLDLPPLSFSSLRGCSSPKLSRDRISSTKLVTATQTIVASKTQALVDRVLRHLPAAHLILQEVNAQEIVLKKSHGTETPSSASEGIIKHVFGFIGHWVHAYIDSCICTAYTDFYEQRENSINPANDKKNSCMYYIQLNPGQHT